MSANLLFIIPSIATGGAEIQLMQQIAGLRTRGIAPRLMVLSDRVDATILARAGLPPSHVSFLGLPSDVLDKAFLRSCAGRLGPAARFVAAHGCTQAVALLPCAHFFARLVKLALLPRGRRLRLIQYHHSVENLLNPRDTFGKRLFFAANQGLAWGCDWSHWHVSEQVRADITGAMATRRNAVLLNACDMDAPEDAEAARKLLDDTGCGGAYTVLLPGRLHPVKGHVLLIEAARRLASEEGLAPSEFRLIFAGDGPERASILAAAAAGGLTGHTVLPGALAHQTLLALYGLVDLVVTPSLAEGFSLVAVEALSRGALLLASDAQGLSEIVRPGENALQFPAGDAGALYWMLRLAWERRGEAIIDREAARAEMRRRFGLEDHLDRMLELLGRSAVAATTRKAG